MTTTNSSIPEQHQQGEELLLVELLEKLTSFLHFLLAKWLWIVLIVLVGGGIGVSAAWFWPVNYTAQLSFVQEEGKMNGGGLSNIASQFGIDIGSVMGSSSMFAGDNIIGLLNSPTIIEEVLQSPWDEKGKISLADHYAEVNGLKKKWNKKWNREFSFSPVAGDQTDLRRDSLLSAMVEQILKKELAVNRRDKKLSFIDIQATFKDEQLAVLFVNRLIDRTGEFYIETKTKRLRQNVDRLQRRVDTIGRLLNQQSYTSAAAQSQVLDINPAFQSAAVGAEIGNRNKMMLSAIYAELTKQLETQKVILTQETPVIQIVDKARLPLRKNEKSKLLFLIAGAFLGTVVAVIFLFFRWSTRTVSTTPKTA